MEEALEMGDELKKYEKFLKNLPVIPEVATKIMSMAEDKLDISFKELENIIKLDPGLTTKILKVANSALYARQREIKSLQMAITLLGFKNIKSLVLLVTASNMFLELNKKEFFQVFWSHSINTAFLSKHIAMRTGKKEIADESFLGGMLHDIGQTAFFNTDQEGYLEIIEQSKKDNRRIEEMEEARFGMNHKHLGASILEKWYFPDLYVDLAREHESLNITSKYKTIIIIVSAADLISKILGFGFGSPDKETLFAQLQPHIGLNDADMEYYKNDFLKDLSEDSLYKECESLFGLKK